MTGLPVHGPLRWRTQGVPGADLILTYFARDAARVLRQQDR
jgi:hypothetical protein